MKILFDHQIFGWQEYGGISRYICQLALEMASNFDQEVSIVSPVYVNKYLSEVPASLKVVGIPIKSIPRTGRALRFCNSILSWPVQKYISPDIVHETYYSSQRIAPKSAKIILTVYDMIHERYHEYFSKYDHTSREKQVAVNRADHVICISKQTKQDLIELFGVDSAKVSVVYLGFDLNLVNGTVLDQITTVRPYLLYVGRRGGYKNFEGLLKAYAASSLLRNEFDLICFGGGRLTEQEVKLFRMLGLSTNNILQITGNDLLLARYYKSASVFVYPSFYEGFGIPPLEAMSLNCPVVCSGVGSILEIVGDAAEKFDPYEIDSIKMAVENVVNNSVLQKDLVSRGQKRIKHFSWRHCAQETLNIYHRVLS